MAVVDYAQKLELTDSDRIGVVGICAGGGYAVAAAKTDHRIKAVAIISAVNIGDGVRKGWFGDDKPSKQLANLAQIAATMSAEARGVPAAVSTYVPPKLDRHTPRDLQEAHQYYLTTRAWHINAPNKMLVRSAPLLLAFDAWHFADLFLNQPILIIYGDKAESKWHSERLYSLLHGHNKRMKRVVVQNARHMDFYDHEQHVSQAIHDIVRFFQRDL